MNTPYSSAVCSRRLVRRHETKRRRPSKTPTPVLVFPTSITSSMALLLPGLFTGISRHDADEVALAGIHEEGAVIVDVHRDALAPVRGPHRPAERSGAAPP